MYRPPNTDPEIFCSQFTTILEKIAFENRPTYLVGDYNIDLLKCPQINCSQKFVNILLSNGFNPKIDRPTKITENSATLIDNIFTNTHHNNTMSGVWLTDITDHLPIYIILPFESSPSKTVYVEKRFYSSEQMQNYKTEMSIVDWSEVGMRQPWMQSVANYYD